MGRIGLLPLVQSHKQLFALAELRRLVSVDKLGRELGQAVAREQWQQMPLKRPAPALDRARLDLMPTTLDIRGRELVERRFRARLLHDGGQVDRLAPDPAAHVREYVL